MKMSIFRFLKGLILSLIGALLLANDSECRLTPETIENLLTNPIAVMLRDVLPRLLGEQPYDINGTEPWFKNYALHDESNEEIATYTEQQLIERAGFAYKNHYALSGDGYITQLIRLINPLADSSKLKQPPVLMTHGGTINPSIYVCSSNIQHHPEPWPRAAEDGSITSWNRSLAFTLANNGYDVWLAGTRGASRQNMGHTKWHVYEPKGLSRLKEEKPTNKTLVELAETFKYWDFSFNEIIEFELSAQIDRIIELTGAEKISFFSYSFSTMSALPFFASRPDYAKHIHQHVVMAPVQNSRGAEKISLFHGMVANLNYELGTVILNLITLTQPMRDMINLLNGDKELRYSLLKSSFDMSAGPSPMYHTNLDPGLVGHAAQQCGFRQIQHYSQQALAGRFQKYDYGAAKNLIRYGSLNPPVWDISDQHIDNWMLVQAANDMIGPEASAQQVYDLIRVKPRKRLVVPLSNHIDLVAAFDNGDTTNLPIMAYFDEYQLPSKPLPERSITEQQRLDHIDRELAKFVPGVYPGDSNGHPDAL